MHKRHLHHILVQIRKISPWYFVIAILISSSVSALALRNNNLEALRLRDVVLEADKQNGDVEKALRELRGYVYGHMNTKLSAPNGVYPPIQLKYRYERLVAEQQANSPNNMALATAAQNHCEALIPQGRSLNRIQCIEDYMRTHGAKSTQPIPDALYKFDFASPVWSPDLAGWSLVLTAVLVITLIARTVFVVYVRKALAHHV